MADNRQFTDHNEIDGVNVYLEDKKLAESPEKNTVASTDYVLLKDTDGIPQKISKANLMSVVKDALGDLLKSNDLSTDVTKVPALNASAFGSVTPANLASVLGVLAAYKTVNNPNIDQLVDTGIYHLTGTVSGTMPTDVSSTLTSDGAILFSVKTTSKKAFQIASFNAINALFVRVKDMNSYTWYDWRIVAS